MYGYIYKIQNLVNKKIYIGQTTQKPWNRWNDHLKLLKKNIHYNIHLQNSYNKFGKSSFQFKVLNYATSKLSLDSLEIGYIKKYKSTDDNYGYNLKEGGSNGKHSIETIIKLSGKNNQQYGKKGKLSPNFGKKTF